MSFWFAGRCIQEPSKSPSKTVARTAEQRRRRELEEGFNSFRDIRSLKEAQIVLRHTNIRATADIYEQQIPENPVQANSARTSAMLAEHRKGGRLASQIDPGCTALISYSVRSPPIPMMTSSLRQQSAATMTRSTLSTNAISPNMSVSELLVVISKML